jgi:SAM-dependent methyltransferase
LSKQPPLKVFTHQYPEWLLKYPNWIRLIYYFNYLIQLRKWYVIRRLKKLLAAKRDSFHLLDAGCGEGQYLFPFVHQYQTSYFKGIDRALSNIFFCKRYAEKNKYTNVSFEEVDIEAINESNKFDIAICISVLPYCKNDLVALLQLNHALKEKGELFLYVPVNNRILIPWYKRLLISYENYETVQQNQRKYTEESLTGLLCNSGFKIVDKQMTYGFFGKLSNELFNAHLILFNAYSLVFKMIIAFSLLVFYPLILFCMILDFVLPVKSGNGIMILARKQNPS